MSSNPDYHLGDKAKVTIGTVTIKGINAMKIPGIVRKSIEVEEFGRDFDFEVPTSNSLIYIMSQPGPEITKSGLMPFTAELLVQGLLALFTAHIGGVTLDFVAGTATESTITDSASGFITAGFEVGQTLIIEGSTSNDTITDQIITAVAAGLLTLTTEEILTTETALAGTMLHGGRLGTA
jgi:hypothetical protein